MAISKLKLAINLLFLLSTPAMASIGSITEFKGAGQIKRSNAVQPANKGSGIEKMDTVSTSSQGKFKITFIDATTVNITENSRLVIDDFVFDSKNSSKGRLGLKVALGTVRYASGAVAHGNPSGVNIRTPTATIAVRGTDFLMSVDELGKTAVILLPDCFDDKDPSKVLDNCVTGAIDVITAAGIVKLTQPFQATVVDNSYTPPTPPVKVNLTMRQINNSLQVSSPPTSTGESLAKSASDAQKQASNPSQTAAEANKNPTVTVSSSPQAASDSGPSQDSGNDSGSVSEVISVVVAAVSSNPIAAPQASTVLSPPVTTPTPAPAPKPIHTNVSPVYDSKMTQIGWAYSLLSQDKQQAATVFLPTNSQTEVSVTQNGIGDTYNFANQKYPTTGDGRPQGIINIVQNGSTGR
jgi:hypothetical protein